MQWLFFALLAALLNALMDFFVKLSSNKISDAVGGALLCACATVVMAIPVLYSKFRGESLLITRDGVLYSALAGISVGLATFFIFKMFSTRVDLSLAVPTLRVGIILFATILGVVLLHEKMSIRLIIGMLLALSGIYVVVTAPR